MAQCFKFILSSSSCCLCSVFLFQFAVQWKLCKTDLETAISNDAWAQNKLGRRKATHKRWQSKQKERLWPNVYYISGRDWQECKITLIYYTNANWIIRFLCIIICFVIIKIFYFSFQQTYWMYHGRNNWITETKAEVHEENKRLELEAEKSISNAAVKGKTWNSLGQNKSY